MGSRVPLASACLLALLLLPATRCANAAAAAGSGAAPPPHARDSACADDAATFREKLEPVIEAAIDGQAGHTAPACERALTWWAGHADRIGAATLADSLVDAMVAAGRGGNPLEAARVALLAATASFKWCDTAPRLADRLMILDLVGMAAWLRAHGVESPGPTAAEESVPAVATALRAKHREALTDRLRTAVREALSAPAGTDAPAQRLLDLVDVVETALR